MSVYIHGVSIKHRRVAAAEAWTDRSAGGRIVMIRTLMKQLVSFFSAYHLTDVIIACETHRPTPRHCWMEKQESSTASPLITGTTGREMGVPASDYQITIQIAFCI